MLLLTTTSALLEITPSAALSLKINASFVDNNGGTITPGMQNTSLGASGIATIVSSPASSTQRNIKSVNIFNNDVSANTVTLTITDGTTAIPFLKMTLNAGEALIYSEGDGWTHYNASGQALIGSAVGAVSQAASGTGITATSTSSFVMAGAGTLLTPQRSGNVLAKFCGYCTSSSTTIDEGIIAQIAYAAGSSVPSVHAAATGSLVGEPMEYSTPTTVTIVDFRQPFNLQSIITGLAIGTQYWFDLQVEAITGASIITIANPVLTVVEL